ncbi:hypothetical protein WJX82_009838 [Trebouxia sp. C0006]
MRFGGTAVPKVLLNQGGDPFLMELYRSIGGVQSMHAVTVVNKRGMTRNALLEASAAQYVVFFYDDVEPSLGCLDAYVQAARQHPEAAGFAGPTCLPHGPGLVAAAVQLSDVGFFWEAPSSTVFPKVPWAVTANMMIKNTNLRFQDCYPKTGGGEDVDFCLRLPGHLVVRHVFNWAYGDGQLLSKFPHLAYRRPPHGLELSCLLLLWHACHFAMTWQRSTLRILLLRVLVLHVLTVIMDVVWNCTSKPKIA